MKDWKTKIRKDHPRMFVNSDTWENVKARALGPEKERWLKLLERVDNYPDDPVCTGYGPIEFGEIDTPSGKIKVTAATPIDAVQDFGLQAWECAFAWRMTGKREYLDKARKMLETSVYGYHQAFLNGRAVSWLSNPRICALTAYDWIYDGLTDEQRRGIIVPLVSNIEEEQPGPGRPRIIRRNEGGYDSGFYGVQSLYWYSGLAAAGDGFCDDLADEHLEKGYELCQKMLEFRASTAGDDGGLSSPVSSYCMGAYPWAHFNFMHTFLSATGYNIAEEWPQLALFPNWIYWDWIRDHGDRPALTYGYGDYPHHHNRLNVTLLYEHMTQYMHAFKDVNPQAARLAASLRLMAPNQDLDTNWTVYPFILTGVEEVEPYPLEMLERNAEKARHFEGMGEVFMRSGWTPDDTYCLFTIGGKKAQHKHFDDNNFVIYRNGYLALDSGSRAKERDHNLKYYYSQTVAHNCVLIHKPGEKLPEHWGPISDDPAGKENYGGMSRVAGNILAFQTNDLFSYVAGDTTAAYGEKCTECVRQFIHLQPNCFVVYDRVGAADPAYRKQWLLHVENEPVLQGRVLQADERDGRLFCETLLPTDGALTLVGGTGKEFLSNGKNWELETAWVERVTREQAAVGRSTLFGNWRLEVEPGQARSNDRFLHVLTACGQEEKTPPKTELLSTESQDGVRIILPGKDVTIWFNRTGTVEAELVFQEAGKPSRRFLLQETVQPQAGILVRNPIGD